LFIYFFFFYSSKGDSDAPVAKRTLFVGGLSESVSVAQLTAAFIPFGDLVDVQLPLDNKTKTHRGFAFVEYAERDDALAALDNMHGAELFGRALKVSVAKPNALPKNRAVWDDDAALAEMQQQLSSAEILAREGLA
jgi:peptidyl-prolyl isomerase E (cyclophilin E)